MKTPLLLSLIFLAPGLLPAATITFQQGVSPTGTYTHVGQDFRGSGLTNTGADMLVGYQSAGVLQIRSVLGFDLSTIPVGSTIDSISLVMTVNNTGAGTISGVGTIELHEITPNGTAGNNMVENQVSWSNWQTGSTWTTSGGDFGSTLANTTVIDGDADNAFDNGEKATFGSTASFVAAAQAALDAGLPLEMILFSPTAEGTTGTTNLVRFGSDDATTAANRPQLVINYTVPEPATTALLALAVAGLGLRRSRKA